MLWTAARREEFKAANDGKTILMAELGAEWKLMSAEDQQVSPCSLHPAPYCFFLSLTHSLSLSHTHTHTHTHTHPP
jgi:hypothetical protein